MHTDKDMLKQKYWQYSVNELGMMDIEAQIKWIHNVKSDELKSNANASTGLFKMPSAGAGHDILNGLCAAPPSGPSHTTKADVISLHFCVGRP